MNLTEGGFVCSCAPEDRPALIEMHDATNPWPTAKEMLTKPSDAELANWYAFKNRDGAIRIAMFPCRTGLVYLLADPKDTQYEELIYALTQVAHAVREAMVAAGITDFYVTYSRGLSHLGDALAKAGFLGPALTVMRSIEFSESGEPIRRN